MMPLWVRVMVKKDMVKFIWERVRSLYLLGAVFLHDLYKGPGKGRRRKCYKKSRSRLEQAKL